jgi:hypothetical protein
VKSKVIAAAFLAFFCGSLWGQLIPSDAANISPADASPFVDAICPENAVAKGCSVCPAETAFAGTPPWNVRTITFGHFLSANSQDAVVSGSGCEDHADGMRGAYLFTKDRSSWWKLWYSPGENTDDCKKLTASDGRDLLVCQASDMHHGVADSFLYLLDAGQDPSTRENDTADIFFALDNSLGSCVKLPDGSTVKGEIESVSFAPASTPHPPRITVTARLGKAVIPDEVLSACDQSNNTRQPIVATVSLRYEFTFNGRKIVPEPGNPPTEYGFAVAPTTAYRPAK